MDQARDEIRPIDSSFRRWFASAAIVGILGLQSLGDILRNDRYFPFQWYPMYAGYKQEGERLTVKYTVFATLADDRKIEIEPGKHLQVNFWQFHRNFAGGILKNSYYRPSIYLREIQSHMPAEIVSLEIRNYPMIIARDGPRKVPSEVVKIVPVEDFRGS